MTALAEKLPLPEVPLVKNWNAAGRSFRPPVNRDSRSLSWIATIRFARNAATKWGPLEQLRAREQVEERMRVGFTRVVFHASRLLSMSTLFDGHLIMLFEGRLA